MVNNETSEMRNYDKNGTLLASQIVFGFGNVWGGEFAAGGEPRFTIRVSGDCPGRVTVTWANGTPNSQQRLVFGENQGSTTIPNNQPCSGTVLRVSGQVQLVEPPGLFGNQGGNGSITGNAGSSACGGYLQMVEGGTCQTSNVAQVP